MAVILQQASSWQCSRYFPILKKARHGFRVRYFRQKTKFKVHFILDCLPVSVPHFISLYYFVLHYQLSLP